MASKRCVQLLAIGEKISRGSTFVAMTIFGKPHWMLLPWSDSEKEAKQQAWKKF